MFKHLLIPLDGSHLAEAALAPAALLSEKFGAAVTLVHVIEKNAPQEVHGQRHLTGEDEACRYLGELTDKAFPPDARVEQHVHTEEVSDVARSITEHTAEFAPDLIIMCAHGGGGFRDLMVGSIAQQVIGMGKTPVLLLHPDENEQNSPTAFRRILVGLDGVPEHEKSLNLARELALKLRAELHLVNVVQTPETLKPEHAAASKLLPGTAQALLDMTEDYALEYLEEKAAALREEGLVVSSEVRRGDVPKQIVKAAEESSCDLIVLGTHGRSGMGAFWSGSVAPKVVGHTRIPLLLVPVKKE
jgi:nucleotide-binding universal stress UspA family protein